MSRQRLSIEALELLDAIDRRGSFASAAEELEKATSALSYGVQKIEQQLGIAIFTRQGRRSVFTPAGRLLLEEGRRILAATSRAADRARELATGWEPLLRIGIEATSRQQTVFDVLADFQRSHGSTELDVCETVLNGGWEALEDDRLDLLIGAPGPVPSHKGLRAVPLGAGDLVPVIGKRHPDFETVVTSPVLELGSLTRVVSHDTVTASVGRNEGFSMLPSSTVYVQTMEQKRRAIAAGLGIGHLPRHQIEAELAAGVLKILPVKPVNPECFLAWQIVNRGKALKALADRMVPALADATGPPIDAEQQII